MKMIKFLAAGLILLTASACGSEMERDATKMAERTIEMKQIQKRMEDRSNLQGKPLSRQEYNRYSQEYIELCNQMFEKYGHSSEESKEFKNLVDKKIEEAEKE